MSETMLKTKDYTIAEMREILKTKDKQGIDRKLQRRNIVFHSTGRGENRIYTIDDIPDPFKAYATIKLGIPANADFNKIRMLYYLLFSAEGFAETPLIEMERIMTEEGVPMARQTITKWINYLQHINYVTFSTADCRYYVIYKLPNGRKEYKEIEEETYKKGWKIYFHWRDVEGSKKAYSRMYNTVGGHPYKKPKMIGNAFYTKEVEELIEVINDSFLENSEF